MACVRKMADRHHQSLARAVAGGSRRTRTGKNAEPTFHKGFLGIQKCHIPPFVAGELHCKTEKYGVFHLFVLTLSSASGL